MANLGRTVIFRQNWNQVDFLKAKNCILCIKCAFMEMRIGENWDQEKVKEYLTRVKFFFNDYISFKQKLSISKIHNT